MASIYTGKQAPIRGPYVKQAFAKSIYKGEDAWLQQRDIEVSVPAIGGNASVDVFGVFDGHGGKQAAVYASKHMMGAVLTALNERIGQNQEQTQDEVQNGMCIPAKRDANHEVSAEAQLAECDVVKEEDRMLWCAQDAIVQALPHALSDAFQKVEADFFEHTKVSGSTATVAAITGWEVLIANVGDSCAYLDTGVEVILVSGNHRLDDNKAERARCLEAGCEVSSSNVEGRPVGPLRVWPGGLAMSRTLGDLEAGAVVTAEPEVRQVTLPVGGGRIVLASDGLWDATNPKTALHHVRAMPASKAATELVQLALRSKGLRDDITVIVIDALPSEDLRTPPPLQRRNGHPTIARSAGAGSMSGEELMEAMSGGLTDQVTVLKPLELSSHDAHWRRTVWERRLAAVQTTYGALLPAPSLTYSDMSTTIYDAAMASSYEIGSMMADDTADSSPNGASRHHLQFGSFDDEQEEEEEWEMVPTKSKGRKHGAEADANASAPPTKELRPADSLSSDGSGLLPVVNDGGQSGLQAPPSQSTNGHLRAPRDGRRGRHRGRGAAAARQQRMGPIQEGPEGRSPPRAQSVGPDFASKEGCGEAGRPQPREHGHPPRRGRRARPMHAPGQDAYQQHEGQHRHHGGRPVLPEIDGSVLPAHGAFEQGRGRGRRGRGRGGFGPGCGGRGGAKGQQAPSDGAPPSHSVGPPESEAHEGHHGVRAPGSFRGRGRGRGGHGHRHGHRHDHPNAGAQMHAANVSAVPYVSVQDG